MSEDRRKELSRRQFVELGIAAAGSQFLGPAISHSSTSPALNVGKNGVMNKVIPDDGWRLWPDVKAEWEEDRLFLPDEARLEELPRNLPTGGWSSLYATQGVSITLPVSVEEYYWGSISSRSYFEKDGAHEYEYANIDPQVKNGAYRGVSWFWRTVEIPKEFEGKHITLQVRGFRQRIEIFLNGELVGYDLIAETAYCCDVTRAARPGQPNTLAIRITNPGGTYDWRDFTYMQWGKYVFHAGRGFGGLDRALVLRAHDAAYLEDTWVLNRRDKVSIEAHAKINNSITEPLVAWVNFVIIDDVDDRELASGSARVQIAAQNSSETWLILNCPQAILWSENSPKLYKLKIQLVKDHSEPPLDTCERTFGFRWFEPEGIGGNARLMLNGHRIRLYSAIEFGYWGFNGLWPTPQLAEQQALAAKTLGLNALQYHRNLGKTEALDADDRHGLLRSMEPGGGWLAFGDQGFSFDSPPTQGPIDVSGRSGDAKTFSERYMEWRILRMMRDHRSHPALVLYCLQNEINPDLHNKRIFRILSMMHREDPSRTIILHSGPKVSNQVFYLPYNDRAYVDDGTGYSGWADVHTVEGAGVWEDDLYVDPSYFTQSSNNYREISAHGEMLGWGTADNHELILEQISRHGGHSYDRQDHEEALGGYKQFLDKWGFRKAFPTPGSLFADIGNKVYDAWSRLLPIMRMSDASDYLVINGWETQPIDSHSGLVDNQRNFKGNPALVASGLARLRPLAQPRGLVHKVGSAVLIDLMLLNETHRRIAGKLELLLTYPSNSTIALGSYSVPELNEQKFVYPIEEAFRSPALMDAGHYRLTFRLSGETLAEGCSDLFIVEPLRKDLEGLNIGVLGPKYEMARLLDGQLDVRINSFDPTQEYDVIVALQEGSAGPPDSSDISDLEVALLTYVRKGTPLLVLANATSTADAYAKTLAQVGAFRYSGMVGDNRCCWMGTWVFVRQHPAYDSLPADQVMKWEYQVDFDHASGLLVDGDGVDVFAGYGRDHDRRVGAATFTASIGRGRVLFQAVRGMQPLLYQRFIANSIAFLTAGRR